VFGLVPAHNLVAIKCLKCMNQWSTASTPINPRHVSHQMAPAGCSLDRCPFTIKRGTPWFAAFYQWRAYKSSSPTPFFSRRKKYFIHSPARIGEKLDSSTQYSLLLTWIQFKESFVCSGILPNFISFFQLVNRSFFDPWVSFRITQRLFLCFFPSFCSLFIKV
jgi:hypothetical protein